MPHTITARHIRRRGFRKTESEKRASGERRDYVGVKYKDGDDRVQVLHPTKGWRDYSIDNPIIGL